MNCKHCGLPIYDNGYGIYFHMNAIKQCSLTPQTAEPAEETEPEPVDFTMLYEYTPTILTIIRFGIEPDTDKVRNYAAFLADKAERNGDNSFAERIRNILRGIGSIIRLADSEPSQPPAPPACERCKYSVQGNIALRLECHHQSPYVTGFPLVSKLDWCGRFEEKSNG